MRKTGHPLVKSHILLISEEQRSKRNIYRKLYLKTTTTHFLVILMDSYFIFDELKKIEKKVIISCARFGHPSKKSQNLVNLLGLNDSLGYFTQVKNCH